MTDLIRRLLTYCPRCPQLLLHPKLHHDISPFCYNTEALSGVNDQEVRSECRTNAVLGTTNCQRKPVQDVIEFGCVSGLNDAKCDLRAGEPRDFGEGGLASLRAGRVYIY